LKLISSLIIIFFFTSWFSIQADVLTLEKAREIALEKNPELLSQESSFKAANFDKWNSALSLIPSASLDGSYTEYEPSFMNADELRSYGITVTQPLFNGGSILMGYLMKKDQAKIADASYLNTLLSTLAEVDSKYFSVLESSSLLEIAKKDLEASSLHLEIAEARYEAGTLSRADLLQMQSQQASREVTLIQMENLKQINEADLANFLQISNGFDLEEIPFDKHEIFLNKVQNISSSQINYYIDYISSLGIEKNPILKMARLTKNISKKSLYMAGGKFLPSLNLSYSKTWEKYDYQNNYDDSQRLMLIASLPIFPILDNYTAFSKARHEYKSSHYDLNATEDAVMLGLKSSVLNLVAAAKSVKAAAIALDFARETFEQMEERFQNNLVSTSDLLDVEVLLTSAENQYITSYYDFLRAKTYLLQQVGMTQEDLIFNPDLFNKMEE